jgi:hypothetical protein
MKGRQAKENDPIVALYQDFYQQLDKLRDQIDNEVLGRLGAEYANMLKRSDRSVDDLIAELTEKALRWQSRRQHSEACNYFNIAETVAAIPDITVNEACHKLTKLYYLSHHETKGDPEILSKKYNQLYDTHYADQIQNRQIRAAKELFGE